MAGTGKMNNAAVSALRMNIYVYEGNQDSGTGRLHAVHSRSGASVYGAENELRIKKLWWKLKRHKGFDILVAHAPARGVNDLEDLPHRGFCLLSCSDRKYQPNLFVHGHVHANYGNGF